MFWEGGLIVKMIEDDDVGMPAGKSGLYTRLLSMLACWRRRRSD